MKLFLGLILLFSVSVSAAEPRREQLLDFEADLIQGERKRPDLFVQMANEKQNLDSVIYGRQDFNDFHRIDRLWRPGYFEVAPKKGGKAK